MIDQILTVLIMSARSFIASKFGGALWVCFSISDCAKFINVVLNVQVLGIGPTFRATMSCWHAAIKAFSICRFENVMNK